jgi:nicotinamide-nucleotide amidase
MTSVAGSSAWFERGFVTYSNEAKQELLGVSPQTLARDGAVSEATAIEMADGALRASHADISVAITGIAGPGGGTPGKPVGTVCFAYRSGSAAPVTLTRHFSGGRRQVRAQSVACALELLLNQLADSR